MILKDVRDTRGTIYKGELIETHGPKGFIVYLLCQGWKSTKSSVDYEITEHAPTCLQCVTTPIECCDAIA